MRPASLALSVLLGACGTTAPASPDAGSTSPDVGRADTGPYPPWSDGLGCDGGCGALPDGGADREGGSADGGTCSGQSGTHLRLIYFGGLPRAWYEHVPASYDCRTPVPVVLNFHGYESNALEQMALSHANDKADQAGFIAVHPEGIGIAQSWNAGTCCGDAAFFHTDDVGFAREIVASLSQRYAIDPKRVFAMGMSNGGFLSHRLACEASDLVAAIAPVAGVMGIATCAPARRVPVLDFHGTSDAIVSYTGDGLPGFASVQSTMDGWAQRDGCGTSTEVVFQKGDATCKAWQRCPAGVDVQLCTLDGGGHTWPGGMPIPTGKTSTDVSATDRAWDFFVAHPMK